MDTSQFFYRNAIFSKSGNQVSLVDIENPEAEKHVLEGWFEAIFQLADGQHTVDELYFLTASRYNGNPPGNLNETIYSVLERMVESKIVVLADIATELPYYLSMPYELLDIEKAKKLLATDRANVN
jgi:hypothetical protein